MRVDIDPINNGHLDEKDLNFDGEVITRASLFLLSFLVLTAALQNFTLS